MRVTQTINQSISLRLYLFALIGNWNVVLIMIFYLISYQYFLFYCICWIEVLCVCFVYLSYLLNISPPLYFLFIFFIYWHLKKNSCVKMKPAYFTWWCIDGAMIWEVFTLEMESVSIWCKFVSRQQQRTFRRSRFLSWLSFSADISYRKQFQLQPYIRLELL